MNKKIIIGIVAVVLVAGGIYWFVRSQSSINKESYYSTTNQPSASLPTQAPTGIATPKPANNPELTPLPTPTSNPSTYNITIQNYAFNPASITVKKGDTVVWTNKDSIGHTVTGNNGNLSSSILGENGTYSYTFNNTGIFEYHCSIHPSMAGSVAVIQ